MAPRPVKPRDLRRLVFISDPQTSPDGSEVAYVHTSIDYEKNDYVKHIWIHDLDTGRDTQFTSGDGKDSNPRWSPTGNKLLFLSSGRELEKKNELFAKRTLEYARQQTWDIAMDKYWLPYLQEIWEELKAPEQKKAAKVLFKSTKPETEEE